VSIPTRDAEKSPGKEISFGEWHFVRIPGEPVIQRDHARNPLTDSRDFLLTLSTLMLSTLDRFAGICLFIF